MSTKPQTIDWTALPHPKKPDGSWRKVGIEIEFSGTELSQVAQQVQQLYGGELEEKNRFKYVLSQTDWGDFSIEVDSTLLKDKRYKEHLASWGIELAENDEEALEKWMSQMAVSLVPVEVVSPPIPLDECAALETLCHKLQDLGAKGTHDSIAYAFGVHFNPEVIKAGDVAEMRDILRAYVLMEDWLRELFSVDWSRRLSTYIQSFGEEYAGVLLEPEYTPGLEGFIDDYMTHHPTRNMGLDMTPLMAHLDRKRVEQKVTETHLVSSRPTYHYRLPNSRIGEEGWSLGYEWQGWQLIERLAAAPQKLEALSERRLNRHTHPFQIWVKEMGYHLTKICEEAGWLQGELRELALEKWGEELAD